MQYEGVDTLHIKMNVISVKTKQGGLIQMFQLVRSRSAKPMSRKHSPAPLLPARSLSVGGKLVAAFTRALDISSTGCQLQCRGPFLADVPARLCHNHALDAAVTFLLQGHTRLLHDTAKNLALLPKLPPENQALPSTEYMVALRTLQDVIEHPVMGSSSEMVCATMLMAYYEVSESILMYASCSDFDQQMMVAEKRGSQYIAHAGAATKLILLRGPHRIFTDFERELLRAQRGHMVRFIVE